MMSWAAEEGVRPIPMDPYEIGWYIESADEEIYGPVSRKALRRFLEDATITPNTLVRHCTQPEARPAADQPGIMDQLTLDAKASVMGDRLDEAWPRKKRDRQALAENALPCAWHKRPAVLVCVRCHAPYCSRCQAKPFRKQFYLCRRCQVGMHNRRFGALILDSIVLLYLPLIALGFAMRGLGMADEGAAVLVINLVSIALTALYMFLRDSLFGGASIGKRRRGFASREIGGWKVAADLRPGLHPLVEPVDPHFQSG